MVPSHVWKIHRPGPLMRENQLPPGEFKSREWGEDFFPYLKIPWSCSLVSPSSSFFSSNFLLSSWGSQLQPKRDLKVLKSFWFWSQIHKEREATGAQWVFAFFSMAYLKDRQGFLLLIWHASYRITSMHDLPTKSVFHTTRNDEKFLFDSCPSSHSQFTHQVYSVFALWV